MSLPPMDELKKSVKAIFDDVGATTLTMKRLKKRLAADYADVDFSNNKEVLERLVLEQLNDPATLQRRNGVSHDEPRWIAFLRIQNAKMSLPPMAELKRSVKVILDNVGVTDLTMKLLKERLAADYVDVDFSDHHEVLEQLVMELLTDAATRARRNQLRWADYMQIHKAERDRAEVERQRAHMDKLRKSVKAILDDVGATTLTMKTLKKRLAADYPNVDFSDQKEVLLKLVMEQLNDPATRALLQYHIESRGGRRFPLHVEETHEPATKRFKTEATASYDAREPSSTRETALQPKAKVSFPPLAELRKSVEAIFDDVGATNLTMKLLKKRLAADYADVDFSDHKEALEKLVMERLNDPATKKKLAKAKKDQEEGLVNAGKLPERGACGHY